MSRAPNYEFQEWWNKHREKNHELFTKDSNDSSKEFLSVEISSPNLDRTAEKDRARSARQLSWVWLLRFHQLANSIAWITNASILLLRTADRRIYSADSPSNSSASRLYRIIKFFLFLVLLLLCVELVAYFKGWHFSPPSAALAEAAVELMYAKWLEIRADYLVPPLQSLANVCIVLFLILSVGCVVLMLGCFWIKLRTVKPTTAMKYLVGKVEGENVEGYPMVLVLIPMCNEREVCQQESTVSEQNPNGYLGFRASKDSNSRNSKAVPKAKTKETSTSPSANASKASEPNEESNVKRCKSAESNRNENGIVKAEEDTKGANGNEGDKKQKMTNNTNNTKPPEPSKDDIHVKARRGQATDNHSLAERVRREKISERMKLLQNLVPGCNKVTGKSLMLDEIINYVQSMQRQIEFLSVKLASVNARPDFKEDSLMSKDIFQSKNTFPNPIFPIDSSASAFSAQQLMQPHSKISNGIPPSPPANATKVSEPNEESNVNRCKLTESNGNENGIVKAEEDTKEGNGNEGDKKQKMTNNTNNTKPPEPSKDDINVRARRGQATDSHSLAERVHREKISERMKLLQNLVPGCNKVTGKALILDEIINYVQSMQRQIEFLSVKLASVNARPDFNVDSLMSKDIFQSENTFPNPIFPIDSSASAFLAQQLMQNPAPHGKISSGTMTQCSVDPLDTGVCPNLNTHLPPINQFTETVPQYPTFCEGDLQTIVQMGFGQHPSQEMALQSENLLGPDQVSHMKIEL